VVLPTDQCTDPADPARSGRLSVGKASQTFLCLIGNKRAGWRAGFKGRMVRSETAKGGHKVFDLAGRGGFAGFKVAFNA
jgi:hypothetical protein